MTLREGGMREAEKEGRKDGMNKGRGRGSERQGRRRGGAGRSEQTGGSPRTKGWKKRITILLCMLIFLHDLVRGFGINAIKAQTKDGGITQDASVVLFSNLPPNELQRRRLYTK